MSTSAWLPLRVEEAREKDVPLILQFIRELAEYEKELARVTATEEILPKCNDRRLAT